MCAESSNQHGQTLKQHSRLQARAFLFSPPMCGESSMRSIFWQRSQHSQTTYIEHRPGNYNDEVRLDSMSVRLFIDSVHVKITMTE